MSFRTVCHRASCFAKHPNAKASLQHRLAVARTTGRFKSVTSENSIHSSRSTSASNRKVSSSISTSSASTASSSTASSTASDSTQSTPLVQTAVAAVAGIATVSLAALIVESSTSSNMPPFDPSGQRFDQSTFLGRFSRMILACDPRLLTYSSEEIQRCKEMVLNHVSLQANLPQGVSKQEMNHSLWEALRISSSSLHPDTGDTIPQPFRMSGYVPYNGPICVAMVASTSTPTLLFWSFVNQSQNALVNYFNRNASSEMDNSTLLKSYSAAVASALTVAFGLATLIQK